MKFCKNCGKELNDSACFCQECGTRVSASDIPDSVEVSTETESPKTAQPPEQNDAAKQLKEPKQVDYTKFNKIFWQLFVPFGLGSFMLSNLARACFYNVFHVFGIIWAIFDVLVSIAFCTLGIIRYVSYKKESESEHTAKRNICYALCMIIGIITFVYVLLMTIAI